MTSVNCPEAAIRARGVTRLCHFTPSRNLPHILRDRAIRSTKHLSSDVRACYTATDLKRLDQHPDHVCCTIEYPNAYYFRQARQQPDHSPFPDWVILLLDATLASLPGVEFCTGNAARAYGSTAEPGEPGFLAMYADTVAGVRGRVFHRRSTHLARVPTDLQAEVLIPGPISTGYLLGVGVRDDAQAMRELTALAQLEVVEAADLDFVLAPTCFDADSLTTAVHAGTSPREVGWERPTAGGAP